MVEHWTKTKGDIAVEKVKCFLLERNVISCTPNSEHQPFDIVAVFPDGEMKRISVKYCSVIPPGKRNAGAIAMRMRSSYSDASGAHNRAHGRHDYDCFACFCPDTDKVYFVGVSEIVGSTLLLRILPESRHHPTI